MKIKLRDNKGWPVVFIKERPLTNIIRAIIHTNIKNTLFRKGPRTEKFTVTVEMQTRWIPHFMSMLKYMETLGSIGSSREVTFYADGDGDFRPKFSTKYKYDKQNPIKDDNGHRLYDAG